MHTLLHNNKLRLILIGLFVCGVLFVSIPFSVLAQGGGADSGAAANDGVLNTTVTTPDGSVTTTQTGQTGQTQGTTDNPTLPGKLEGFVYSISVGIGGAFLWAGGQLLDYAVSELVVGMGTYLQGGVGVAIDKMWVLVRDAFNVVFIFGLIYIGFRTILFSEDTNTRKTLGWLIVAALMINFSLFITKAIVDLSNATSYQIYQAMDREGRGGGAAVTASFMNSLKITSYANTDVLNSTDNGGLLGGPLMAYGILMMFVMLIAAFVFAAGAFLMISRFIGLIIFMIFSPAMFLGLIFPLFASYQKLWWRKFLQYAFVGPAYIFMLYITLWVIGGLIHSDATFAAAFASGGGTVFMIFLNFFIISGFLIAALFVSKEMGIYGAAGSMNMLKNTGNYMRRSAQGFAGRNTIGWISDGIDKGLEKRGYRSGGILRTLPQLGASAKFGSGSSSKDVAEAKKQAKQKAARFKQTKDFSDTLADGVGAAAGTSGDRARIAMERGISGADTELLITSLKKHKPDSPEYKAIVSNMTANQFDSVMKAKEEDLSLNARNRVKMARSDAVTSQVSAGASAAGAAPAPGTIGPATPFAAGFAKADMAQLKVLGAEKIEEYAGKLKPTKLEEILKSDNFTATEKARIEKAHETQLIAEFEANPASVFANRKDKDVAKLPKKIFRDPRSIRYITSGILSELKSELDANERTDLKNKIEIYNRRTGGSKANIINWFNTNSRGVEF